METLEPIVPPPAAPKKVSLFRWVFLTFAVTAMVVGGSGYYFWTQSQGGGPAAATPNGRAPGPAAAKTGDVAQFSSAEDFQAWLAQGGSAPASGNFGVGLMRAGVESGLAVPMAAPSANTKEDLGSAPAAQGMSGTAAPEETQRYSGTNVQVVGIDEPDIVKTDGREIFYSPEQVYWGWGMPVPMPMIRAGAAPAGATASSDLVKPDVIRPPQPRAPGTRTIKAFPPADLKLDGKLDRTGDLLLAGKTLVVLSTDGLHGYDVSVPSEPAEKWAMTLENGHSLLAARLYQDKVYVVVRAGINAVRPCPLIPFNNGDLPIAIPCGAIYHPIMPTPSDTTYSALAIDAATGKVDQSASFVGSWDSSAVYMSEKYLYVTYPERSDAVGFFLGFLQANGDLAPAGVIERLQKLAGYELSDQAKLVELEAILQNWRGSLSDDDQLKLENEMNNRMAAYYKDHQREWQKTGIVRLTVDGLVPAGTGSVPGAPLDQFSLDEYGSYLRVATTTGGRGSFGWRFGFNGAAESVNDVYVLGPDLSPAGSVQDLGRGERIYAVRFIEDRGYVVTFKETDPFFVIDLSDPQRPALKGELKLPGYSAYLHPLAKNEILGIGKADNQVKVSIFDVSDPAAPADQADYTLDEYWSDILNTHHAFLQDAANSVFFLPGSKGGYVFSYAGGQIKMVKAVSGVNAKRALYINDYLYILADDRITVLNEKDWTEANKLELPGWSE